MTDMHNLTDNDTPDERFGSIMTLATRYEIARSQLSQLQPGIVLAGFPAVADFKASDPADLERFEHCWKQRTDDIEEQVKRAERDRAARKAAHDQIVNEIATGGRPYRRPLRDLLGEIKF